MCVYVGGDESEGSDGGFGSKFEGKRLVSAPRRDGHGTGLAAAKRALCFWSNLKCLSLKWTKCL